MDQKLTVSLWPEQRAVTESDNLATELRREKLDPLDDLGVLVLVTAVTLYRGENEQRLLPAGVPVPLGTLALLFGLAGLVALWANSLPGLLAGWTLLSVVFFALLFSSPAMRERPRLPSTSTCTTW